MPHIDIYQGRIYIRSELSERDLIKQVPGTRWDKDESMWHAPLSWSACIALRAVFGSFLTLGEDLREWAKQMRAYKIDPAMALRPAMEAPELMASEPALYPFQRVGVRFLETAGSALLADDMGSGKTIQLIRALYRLEATPVLVICPNSMKLTWKEEFHSWAEEMKVSVIGGSAAQRRKAIAVEADVYVINWESLRLHSNLAPYGSMALTGKEKEPKELNEIEWAAVIADEAHRAKDPTSKQTRALWAVSRGAKFRFAATGTPIESHPGELWSIMNFVSPDNFPVKTKYVERYCHQIFNRFGGMEIKGLQADTMEEFHKIVDPMVLRRPKDVILPQLPEKIENVRYIPMSAKQEKAYRQMQKTMIAEVADDEVTYALNPLQQFIRLSQFASSFAEIERDELQQKDRLRLTAPSNKVDAFLELLDEAVDEPVVAFAESKQLINLAAAVIDKKGISVGLITGDTSTDQRQAYMREFQEGRLRVMLCTSAGAEGITLTAARILVFLQRFWSSIKNQQATDRIHRIGQERGVEIITFASIGTVDEHRERVLGDKREAIQEVLKDEIIRAEMLKWGIKR